MWAWFRSLLAPERPAPPVPGLTDQEARAVAEFGRHYQINFNQPELLKLALTHRSYLSVTGQGPRDSNERLEFLGDSVLGLVTSEFLYRAHPNEHEGQLTKTKSLLVSKAILSRRALAMGLGRFVLMSHSEVESGGRQRLSILADAFESVVGAIYLDQGFEASRSFIERWLLRDSREISADKRHTNYKSQLQEYVQSTFRTHPVYRIRSEVGPDHSKQFVVEVTVGRRSLGEGKGHNKKEAEQAAARDAIERVSGSRDRDRERDRDRDRDHDREGERERARERRAETPREAPVEAVAVEEPDGESEGEGEGDAAPRRRRGRRGGRGRRRAEGAAPTESAVETTEADAEVVKRAARPSPEPEDEAEEPKVERPRRREPRAEAPPRRRSVAAPPKPEETEPEPAHSFEDEHEEIGRPEGPLDERHIDPYEIEAEPGVGRGRSIGIRPPTEFHADTETSSGSEPPSEDAPAGEPEARKSFGRRPGRPRRSR